MAWRFEKNKQTIKPHKVSCYTVRRYVEQGQGHMDHSTSTSKMYRCMSSAARFASLAASLSVTLSAQALPTANPASPDPLDANASVPTLSYESSFAQYRRLGEEKPASWRNANDTVARIGGWRVYAREAQQPDPLPPNAPAATPAVEPPSDAPPAAKSVPVPTRLPMPAAQGGHITPWRPAT
jgi:hypothetical protein